MFSAWQNQRTFFWISGDFQHHPEIGRDHSKPVLNIPFKFVIFFFIISIIIFKILIIIELILIKHCHCLCIRFVMCLGNVERLTPIRYTNNENCTWIYVIQKILHIDHCKPTLMPSVDFIEDIIKLTISCKYFPISSLSTVEIAANKLYLKSIFIIEILRKQKCMNV